MYDSDFVALLFLIGCKLSEVSLDRLAVVALGAVVVLAPEVEHAAEVDPAVRLARVEPQRLAEAALGGLVVLALVEEDVAEVVVRVHVPAREGRGAAARRRRRRRRARLLNNA